MPVGVQGRVGQPAPEEGDRSAAPRERTSDRPCPGRVTAAEYAAYRDAVAELRARYEAAPDTIGPRINRLGELTQVAIDALDAGDAAALGAAMDDAHDVLAENDPLVVRYALAAAHYRSSLEITPSTFTEAEAALGQVERWRKIRNPSIVAVREGIRR